jgi:hypothetical protein
MMWRVGQKVLGSLSRNNARDGYHWPGAGDLEKKIIELFHMGIRRGLTPHDALVVATALQNENRGSLWDPELAKRAGKH